MDDTILSVGIDIGTTTTQLIFSQLTICTVSCFGVVPRAEVTEKKVIYRSAIYFTPLNIQDEIDEKRLADIIQGEYNKAALKPEDISTGAVIITGEITKKRNAAAVATALSNLTGDFVVATAGPDLEALLAGRGAMTDVISEETGIPTVNLDIGGGTTNLSLFKDGKIQSVGCYDIGGRLMRIDNQTITYISPKLPHLLKTLGMPLNVGDRLSVEDGLKIANAMADILAQSIFLSIPTPLGNYFITNHSLILHEPVKQLTFSGGVADCIYDESATPFAYGDLGVLLGKAIREHPLFSSAHTLRARETMRATVIGAGTHSMEISGSTILYDHCSFPLKNLPIIRVNCATNTALSSLVSQLREGLAWLSSSSEESISFAIALDGPVSPSFVYIEQLAHQLTTFFVLQGIQQLVPIVVENDFGKALGQALKRRQGEKSSVLCIDGIACHSGDYIDIGAPLSGGSIVPVVVKTLIFS